MEQEQLGRILIVDNEPSGRAALRTALADTCYRIIEAQSGADALAYAARACPDLVLLATMLPAEHAHSEHIDGFEVCRILRADPQTCVVPVLLVAARHDPQVRMRGFEAGADDVLVHPLNDAELCARTRAILRRNCARRIHAERTRFEWVVEQSADGFLELNADTTIRFANRKARQYLYLAPDTALPTRCTFLELAQHHYQCEPADAWCAWPEPVATRTPEELAVWSATPARPALLRYLVRPETRTTPVLWLQAHTLDSSIGSGNGRMLRLHDVTEQMNRKRQMWTFHSLISHKLRSPMTSLLNSLHLLVSDSAELPVGMQEFVHIALKSMQRLRSQIEGVLDYLRTPDLASAGQGCRVGMLPLLVAQGCDEVGIEPAAVEMVGHEPFAEQRLALSPQAVELIVRQILENARKFHPRRAPHVEVTISQRTPDALLLAISDDGISLAPEHLTSVMLPYYQAEKSFSGEVPGMGLGLAMVSNLLWSVGGTCTLTNRPIMPGVVVELHIPFAKEEAAEHL